jgi:hypothetical protein
VALVDGGGVDVLVVVGLQAKQPLVLGELIPRAAAAAGGLLEGPVNLVTCIGNPSFQSPFAAESRVGNRSICPEAGPVAWRDGQETDRGEGTSMPTIRGSAIVLVAGKNAGVRDIAPLDSHVGLVSSGRTVCDICRVWELLLLHHAQAAAGRLGAVAIDAFKFGAGCESNANSLALLKNCQLKPRDILEMYRYRCAGSRMRRCQFR